MAQTVWKNWGDHPVVVMICVLAALCGIAAAVLPIVARTHADVSIAKNVKSGDVDRQTLEVWFQRMQRAVQTNDVLTMNELSGEGGSLEDLARAKTLMDNSPLHIGITDWQIESVNGTRAKALVDMEFRTVPPAEIGRISSRARFSLSKINGAWTLSSKEPIGEPRVESQPR